MKKTSDLCNIKKLHKKGNHLIIDGTSNAKLNNKKFIKKFINELTKKINMTPISKPLIVKYKANSKDKTQNGITATIILAESNITIHTYPAHKFFCLDIFSCKEFPINKTINHAIKKLQITKYKTRLLKRGIYNERN